MTGPGEHAAAEVRDAWDETAAFRGIRVALPPAYAHAHERPGQIVKAQNNSAWTVETMNGPSRTQ